MPWMQRLTWSGTALHAGVVPGYPASHGCVRLPFSVAPKLFQLTSVGENVVVTGDRVAPKPIEHDALFQPAQPQAEVALASAGQDSLGTAILPEAAAAERLEPPARVETIAADPVPAPLRILVTRRTERDRIIGAQYLLASLGYLKPQNFTGRLGNETLTAIKAFQKDNGLRETGAFSDEISKKIHEVAGKAEPPEGHLYVRQDFRPVFDLPIAIRNPEQPLGTHVFTAMGLAPDSGKAQWIGLSLEGSDSPSVLDRIEFPALARATISERLTAGSTLIVADTSVNSAILRDGEDFLVLAKVTPATSAVAPRESNPKHEAKKTKAAPLAPTPRLTRPPKRAAKTYRSRPDPYGGFRLFRRW
jgi:peptidoglycan hydrolase-like protein with peptidoglycan-binding domain